MAALAAAALAWVAATLPPAAVPSPARPARGDRVVGAYHVHSNRSDGSGSPDAIAAAAARAGLRFVILTDHGDATRTPDPPQYLHGVLVIDAVEISSAGGHVVALNLRAPSPYPLAGETREVVADVHRQGGWAIAAHPESPRQALRWRAGGVAFDGIEWFNADSEWRAQSPGSLVAAAARTLFRAPEAIASLFQSPALSITRWDGALRSGPVFSLAAVDAHARLGADPEPGAPATGSALTFPGYATMFRTVAQTVALAHPLSGDAGRDAMAVLEGIGAGRSYSVVRAFIDDPLALDFAAIAGTMRTELGGVISDANPVVIRAAVPAGTRARLVLFANGREVAAGEDSVEFRAAAAGAYRVEARLANRPTPWIVSNAIWVGTPPAGPPTPPLSVPPSQAIAIPVTSWTIESDRTSTASIEPAGADLRVRYHLGPGSPAGQYVALASGASGDAAIERITFIASSGRPMRMSVQVRVAGSGGGLRWGRSVYVDSTPRPFEVSLADLEPLDRRSPLRPIAARVQSILLVVDTVNTKPGTAGEMTFRNLAFVPARAPEK